MFFKNVIFYKISDDLGSDLFDVIDQKLESFKFSPPGSQTLSSVGWAKPFNQESTFSHRSGDLLLLCLKKETRLLPPQVVNKEVVKYVSSIEKKEGRTVGKRETQDIKNDIVLRLLPTCFTKELLVYGYIDLARKLLVINTSSYSHAEEFAAMLRKALGSLPIMPAQSSVLRSSISVMTDWVLNSSPEPFEIMEKAILSSPEKRGGRATLKYQDLNSDEVIKHIECGKEVIELHLSFDDTLTFTLCDDFKIKSIKFSDVVADENDDIPKDDVIGRLDADFALMSGELSRLFSHLFEAFGLEDE